jgi:hypothetical protein
MPSPAFNVQTHVIQEKPIRAGASLRSLILGLCYCSIQLLRASPSSRVALCTWVSPDTPSSPRRNNNHHRTTLGIASQIYVISLRRRQYRREAFDVFRVALGPAWTYFDATDTSDPAIARIMANVRTQRDQNPASMTELLFRWPGGIDAVVSSSEVIGAAESDLWAFSAPASADDSAEGFVVNSSSPETSAIPLYTPGPPGYNILTASELACWHSHLGVIHLVANSPEHNATVVLEDDVDMGRDIHERLERVWDAVPAGWDIVFLGACPKERRQTTKTAHDTPAQDTVGQTNRTTPRSKPSPPLRPKSPCTPHTPRNAHTRTRWRSTWRSRGLSGVDACARTRSSPASSCSARWMRAILARVWTAGGAMAW